MNTQSTTYRTHSSIYGGNDKKVIIKKSKVALLSFMFIFYLDPIFYSYSSLVNIDIPVGMLGILISFFLVPFYYFENKYDAFGRKFIAFLILAPICLAYFSGRGYYGDFLFWFRSLSFFVLGYYFPLVLSRNFTNISGKVLFSFLLLFLCLCFVLLDDLDGNYLRVSDAVVVFSFFVISLLKNKSLILFFVTITSFALFLIGSRFGLLAFLFSSLLMFIMMHSLSKKVMIFLISLPSVFFAYVFLVYEYSKIDNIHSNRLLRLIFEPQNDTSLQSRMDMTARAIDVFSSNFIVGDYKYYLADGLVGNFSHNLVSFWAELGVLGLLISLIFLYAAIRVLFFSLKNIRNCAPVVAFAFLSSVTLILAMLFAKSYYWTPLFFYSGLCFSLTFSSGMRGEVVQLKRPPPSVRMSVVPSDTLFL